MMRWTNRTNRSGSAAATSRSTTTASSGFVMVVLLSVLLFAVSAFTTRTISTISPTARSRGGGGGITSPVQLPATVLQSKLNSKSKDRTQTKLRYAPTTTDEIYDDSRTLYQILWDGGPVYMTYAESSTVRFTYVTPPPRVSSSSSSLALDWNDADVMMADADIMTTVAAAAAAAAKETANPTPTPTTTTIFTEVSQRYHNIDKPIALYLPGLDGYGTGTSSFQFNDLAS